MQCKHLTVWLIALLLFCLPLRAQAVVQDSVEVPESVEKVLSMHPELSEFADIAESAGVEAELTGKDVVVTLFAPTNEAMEKIPDEVMERIKAEKDGLRSFVLYHAITGSRVRSGSIKDRKIGLASGSGEILMIDGEGDKMKVNDAEIVAPDIMTAQGIVHIVQAPLIPSRFLQATPPPSSAVEIAESSAKPVEPAPVSVTGREETSTVWKVLLLCGLLGLAFWAGVKVGARSGW